MYRAGCFLLVRNDRFENPRKRFTTRQPEPRGRIDVTGSRPGDYFRAYFTRIPIGLYAAVKGARGGDPPVGSPAGEFR